MVGIFKMWSVSGIITKAAQGSEAIHNVGAFSNNIEFVLNEVDYESQQIILHDARLMLSEREPFYDFIRTRDESLHDEATKYLVSISAAMHGADSIKWDWKKVRRFAQGLYGSMMSDRLIFETQNMPMINLLLENVELLIEKIEEENESL